MGSAVFYREEQLTISGSAGWACVTFATAEMADTAIRRLKAQANLFGAFNPLEIRHTNATDEAVLAAAMQKEEPRPEPKVLREPEKEGKVLRDDSKDEKKKK